MLSENSTQNQNKNLSKIFEKLDWKKIKLKSNQFIGKNRLKNVQISST